MPNTRISEIDNFLRYYANVIRDNPDYEYTTDFFYAQLKNYGIDPNNREDITDLWPNLTEYYKNSNNLNVYQDMRQMSFLQFRSHHLPNSSDCYKMYLTFDKSHFEQGVKTIFDFIEKNNITSASKISSYVRSDGICLRIYGEEDAIKVLNFINSNNYLTSFARPTNPFVYRHGVVALGYDDGLSYNATLSQILSAYYNSKITSNTLNTVSHKDFAEYAKHYGEAIYSSLEAIEWLETTPDFTSAIKRCYRNPNEVHVNYQNVFDLIGKSVQEDFQTMDYFNSCREYMDLSNRKTQEDNMNAKRTEPYALLDNYIYYCLQKYGSEEIVASQLQGYIDGNTKTITRDNNFRQLFETNLPPERVKRITSGNPTNYIMVAKSKKYANVLNALEATMYKYGIEQVREAIKRGLNGDYSHITNGIMGYRKILSSSFTPEDFRKALEWMIERKDYIDITDEIIEMIPECLSTGSRTQ